MIHLAKHSNAGTLTPQVLDASERESAERQADGSASPQSGDDDTGQDQTMEDDIDEGEENRNGQATPANESDAASRPSTPARGRSSIPMKRRAGRPPRTRGRPSAANDDAESRDAGSDAGTPRRRGGWRGRGFGGGRWGKPRGGPSHVTQVPLDKEGNMATVKDDEIELPDDPEGETKVNKNGILLGDREYKVRVFTISGKGDRLYMLSTEPARCIGFRDSYLFFQKHKTLWKIILTEEAKRDLIERSLIPHSYKGRAIGVVTARSVFREFGAKIIIGGRKVTDDYQAAAARARGDVEGELAVPEDKIPGDGDTYDKNRFVAWHGASSVYHSGGPSIPLPNGKAMDGKKRRVVVTGSNWMLEHAREARYVDVTFHFLYKGSPATASRFNSSIAAIRRQNLEGVYDTHTNIVHYPRIMQPTHARWEPCDSSDGSSPDKAMEQDKRVDSRFPRIPSILRRNFLISDTYYVSPPVTGLGFPGPDGDYLDVGPPGLAATAESVAAAMTPECLAALKSVGQEARQWKEAWQGEGGDGARAQLRITYNQG
ncbi:MAG: hypothetical protein L6R39_000630 [Caloplaca ligustica]|nr:MAG: hypothetical protein L6R39_000630 [Caloplaca ligustica]